MANRRAACGVLLLALPLAAQTDTAKPASLEGTVKDSVSGAPIPRARVLLGRYSATASAEGKFTIGGIVPGNYRLTAQRPGFVMPRKPIRMVLGAGERKTETEIALVPAGGIAGRVTDADGAPVEGARVQAEDGRGAWSRTTDESGQFRIGGLAPGRYRVVASRDGPWFGRPEIRTDGTVEHHDATTYYPAVLTPEAAGTVLVQPGIDSTGVEIRLVRVPFVRVSGRAVGLPRGAQDATVTAWRGTGVGESMSLGRDGTFDLWRLDPGPYRLNAEWTAPNGERFETAGVDIEVGDSNLDNIELRLIPPSTIPGHLEYEDDAVKQMVRTFLPGPLVQISPTGSVPEDLGEAPQVAADGTFRLEKVPPDRYWLGLAVADDQVYVKSMRLGSMPIDGAILDLRNGSGGADLTLMVSAATGAITGAVQDDQGSAAGTVVVLVEASGETNFGPRRAIAGADGAYSFAHVPPGAYKLVATSEENPTAAENHVLGYENQMDTVTVGDGEKVTQDLRRRTPE